MNPEIKRKNSLVRDLVSFKGPEGVKRLRKFCRTIERNMNNFVNPETLHDTNRECKGYYLKIDSINGIKKVFKGGKRPTTGKFYVRFFMTFFNEKNLQFVGNSYKSPLLKISFNDTGHYELAESDPVYVYFLTRSRDNLGASQINPTPSGLAGSNLARSATQAPPQTKCVLEVIFVEASDDDRIITQTCEGWGLLDINSDNTNVNPKGVATGVYLGTPRYLLHKSVKGMTTINGASIMYSCCAFKELEAIKFLLPNYVIVAHNEPLPGLLQRYLPKQPILNEVIKTVQFYDVYLKNVEIEISPQLEQRLLNFAFSYRKQKYNIPPTAYINPVVIKERKLKCGVHNTWCFVNSNGLENVMSLSKRENVLFHKGVLHIDNFFTDENSSCAFVIELNYTLTIPCSEDNREEQLSMIMGYSILVPDKINNENHFLSANLITGPGETIYGEHLWDPLEADDRIVKINFILSRNKDNYDKTYKEKEIEEIKGNMAQMKAQMKIDYDKLINTKDKEKEMILKRKEMELAELEAKLEESQRSLRAIYDKEMMRTPKSSVSIPTNDGNKSQERRFLVEELRPTEHAPNFGIKASPTPRPEDKVPTQLQAEKNEMPSYNDWKLKEKESIIPQFDNKEYNFAPVQDKTVPQAESTFVLQRPTSNIKSNNLNYTQNNRYNTDQVDKFDPDEYQDFKAYMEFKRNGKKMTQNFEFKSKEFEDENNTRKIIYDKNTNDISRRDKADLIAKGILGLDIKETSESLLTYTLDKELQDDFKSNNFTIQFLAFKPVSELKDYNTIPNRIFFQFNFWDFEYFTTNVAIVNKPSSQIAPSSTPLVLTKEGAPLQAKSDEKEMKIQIEFDPSIDQCVDLKDFVAFLMTKQIFMEVYDADKLFLIGFVKIPLRDLLRQGKASVIHTKEYEIFDHKFNTKGYIQVFLKSVGKSTYKPFKYDPNMLRVVNTKDRFSCIHQKKKVRVNPMDLDRISTQEKEYIAKHLLDNKLNVVEPNSKNVNLRLNVDPETEKRLRVMKHLNGQTGNKVMLKEEKLNEIKQRQEKENEFFKKLNYANKIKEMKRKDIISSTIKQNNHNTLNVSLVMGNPHFVNFIIHNNSEVDDMLYLLISKGNATDPSDQKEKVEDTTVSIVNSPDEWKFYTESFKLIKPNDYNSISPQNYLIIKPNESIPLLLKLLSYEHKSDNSTYTVWVHRKNGQPLYFLTITIVKVFPLVDHTFNFFFPENKYATVKIPNPFRSDKLKSQKLLDNFICSNKSINLQLDPMTNNFYFKEKILSEGHVNSFYLFLYADAKRTNLYSTWKFELVSMQSMEVHGQLGAKITNKISIDAERNAKTVQFYSSNNEILFFPEKFNTPMILVPGMTNEVKYVVYPKTDEQEEVIIYCVDVSSREVLKGWLVRVLPEKPVINQIYKVDCNVNSITNIKYEFTNPIGNWVIFNFESNNNDVLSVVDARMPFNSGENKYVNIRIHSQSETGRTEVLVFVSDTEEMYSEIILFQLNYK